MISATVELITAPDAVEVGKPFAASFRLSNHGNEVLQPGVVKLGSNAPQDNHYWGDTRAQIPVPVGPGQGHNFEVSTFVPQQVGQFPFAWRAVWEGRAWFGVGSAVKTINVVAPAPPSGGGGSPVPTLPAPTPPATPPQDPKVIIGKWPKKRADPFDLTGCMIVNTDAFPANGQVRTARWKNDTADRLRLSAARIWLGVSGGGKCDAHGQLEREDGTLVAVLQADHYVDGPAGAAVEHQHWSGSYLVLEPGESLLFVYFANGFTPNCQAHFTVSMWGHQG